MPKFPHMKETDFPHLDNVNVYKYENELDYSRFDYTQMNLCICTVPWDMGEAHVGQRTISGIGNVVYFGSTDARDAWFDAIPDSDCVRLETKFKELHRDNEIIVPLPFDIACKYNYLTVEYSLFANDDSQLEYEHEGGVRKWFWFIREVEFVAPNATRLHLLNDAWQTFIYDVDIPYMILERGHAPLFKMRASAYLDNPLENSDYLLEPDSNLETANEKVSHTQEVIFDDDVMYAVFVTSANVSGNWGTNNSNSWTTPATARYHTDGNLSYSHVAVPCADLYDFLNDVETQHPQFKQTVQCVYLLSAKLMTITATLSFAGHDVHLIGCTRKSEQLLKLDTDMFGFDSKYAQLAKLYTYPYSWLEIADENGNIQQVRIENTTGALNVEYCFNTAYPALNLNAHINGIGSNSTHTIDFKNVGTRHFNVGGKWYEVQYDWAIPTFGVILSASKEYAYSGYFDRQQAEVEYAASYDNEKASANSAYSNANDSAKATYENGRDNALSAYYNARANNAQSSANKNAESYNGAYQLYANALKIRRDTSQDNAFIDAGRNIAGQQLAISAVSNGVGSLATGAFSGAVAGGLAGAAIGGGTGALNAVAGAASSVVSWGAGNQLADAQKVVNYNKANSAFELAAWQSANIYGTNMSAAFDQNGNFSGNLGNFAGGINYQITHDALAIGNYTANVDRVTANGGNMAARTVHSGTPTGYSSLDAEIPARNLVGTNVRTRDTAQANALRTRNTIHNPENNTGNADRTRNAAIQRVANTTRAEGMKAPYDFGNWSNGENANVKPKMLSANVCTQGKAGISFAGDEFLRYGYRYNRNYDFDGNWCIGQYFTYWKLSDFWVKGLNVPDLYMDKLRFFLFGGVTVWNNPEAIGHVSIYENGV